MRILFPSLVMALLVLAHVPHASAQANTQNAFPTNLSLGSSGVSVLLLQQTLNRYPDTRIASTGPGSPGNETGYFGLLTRAAVVRFQAKYASAILAPAGLARGNGYVGFYTRITLNTLSAPTASATPVALSPAILAASTTTSQNPNLVNLDTYLASIDSMATEQGSSTAAIEAMNQQVREAAATTTDYRATFLRLVQEQSHQAKVDDSFVGKVVATIARIFMPVHVFAATGVPFGGSIIYAQLCNAGVWNILLTPLPPSFAAILSYMSGSQAFLSYNLTVPTPGTTLLGEYVPGPGICVVGVAPIPSSGLITPMVGSSSP